MPFVGLGVHVAIALFFAVHAVRTGQQTYWLFILFSFPLLGSVVYFVTVYLPNSRLQHGARKAVRAASRVLDPTRELREARDAFQYTPTAQNQMRLASALLEAGQPAEAAENYEACLKGPFATDSEMRFGAARAFVECARFADALVHLDGIRSSSADYRPEQVSLLRARALTGAGRAPEASAELESAVARFGTFDAKAEYAIFAARSGNVALANKLKGDLDATTKRWGRHNRDLNAEMLRRIEEAYAGMNRRG